MLSLTCETVIVQDIKRQVCQFCRQVQEQEDEVAQDVRQNNLVRTDVYLSFPLAINVYFQSHQFPCVYRKNTKTQLVAIFFHTHWYPVNTQLNTTCIVKTFHDDLLYEWSMKHWYQFNDSWLPIRTHVDQWLYIGVCVSIYTTNEHYIIHIWYMYIYTYNYAGETIKQEWSILQSSPCL